MDTNSSLLKSIRTMTEGVISSAPFDRTRKAQVLSIDSDSTCKIKMDGVEYPRVKVYGNISGLTINQIVRVIIPENQPSQMFVLSPIAMDKVNPTGTGSFSLNRKANTTIGDYSFAEGFDTTASKYGSHAEGAYTTAGGEYSHAEGVDTTASKFASHAEGLDTIAGGNYSHAQGKYNVDNSNHADIVGNGTARDNRSNAYALDWNGNGYFAGDVYVGCEADSSSGTKLATLSDIPKFYTHVHNISVTVSANGQTPYDIPLMEGMTINNVFGVTQANVGNNNLIVKGFSRITDGEGSMRFYIRNVASSQQTGTFYTAVTYVK